MKYLVFQNMLKGKSEIIVLYIYIYTYIYNHASSFRAVAYLGSADDCGGVRL